MAVEDEEARVPPGADLERYLRELAEFVGLSEADAVVIRESAPAVLKHEAALTSALYEHFLRFPATARFFLAPDGTPDRTRIERRKHPRLRLLPADDRHLAQPPGARPGRQDSAAVHGGRDESHPDRAGRDLPRRAGRPGAGARGGGGVEQAAAAPSERAADRLPDAVPARAARLVRLTAGTGRRIVSAR